MRNLLLVAVVGMAMLPWAAAEAKKPLFVNGPSVASLGKQGPSTNANANAFGRAPGFAEAEGALSETPVATNPGAARALANASPRAISRSAAFGVR
jgi:hypothetical protein